MVYKLYVSRLSVLIQFKSKLEFFEQCVGKNDDLQSLASSLHTSGMYTKTILYNRPALHRRFMKIMLHLFIRDE